MENFSIESLKQTNNTEVNQQTTSLSSLKGASIEEIAPYTVKEDITASQKQDIFNKVDSAIDRIAQESIDYVEEVEAKIEQEEIERELEADSDDIDSEIENELSKENDIIEEVQVEQEPVKTIVNKKLIIDEDDFDEVLNEDDELEIEDEQEKAEAQLKEIKTAIKEKITPITNKIDLSSFTIAAKPITLNNALKVAPKEHIADWVLVSAQRAFSIKEFSGFEIEKLNPESRSRNLYNQYKDIYQRIFDHIVDDNKPATMEEWVKLLKFTDLQHVYFGIYKSSFADSNFIPYNCPHCQQSFMSDNIDIEEMVKYKDEASKEFITKLCNSDTNTQARLYEVQNIQISNEFVFGFREPSVYNIIFENAILDEKFRVKYSDLLNIISYIDSIYVIDYSSNTLRPIDLKNYPNNMAKTCKEKVLKYAKILQSISSDQFYQVTAYIEAIGENNDEVSYVLPAITCPHCKKEIEEVPTPSDGLLFTRHQLAGIANS